MTAARRADVARVTARQAAHSHPAAHRCLAARAVGGYGFDISGTEAIMRQVWVGLALALTGAAVELIAGPGHRLGWWPFTTGFVQLRTGTIAALCCLPLLAWALWRARTRQQRALALLGLLLALPAAALPLSWLYMATHLPVIHDIS